MTKHPYIANRKMTVPDAQSFMKECGIRHLPVIEGGRIIGVVSDRDLNKAVNFVGPGDLLVEDVMVPDPYSVDKSTPLSQVVKVMADRRYGCAIVKDESEQVIGIFTTTDALRLLSQFLTQGNAPENLNDFPDYISW